MSLDIKILAAFMWESLISDTASRKKLWSDIIEKFLFSAPIVEQPQCTADVDCASKLACFSGTCRNPCIETKPCAVNAACTVVDTLPLRTMSCSCLPGFVGDADVECKPGMLSYC
jgi:hypothetical protein